jgi:hypothetical protein
MSCVNLFRMLPRSVATKNDCGALKWSAREYNYGAGALLQDSFEQDTMKPPTSSWTDDYRHRPEPNVSQLQQ